ncbi:MAG: antitoxin [Gammaproteobacteria bacterium]|nr:antitoxin [Gammaproteobacteria bacterium]
MYYRNQIVPRLSIDITHEEHRKLKAIAALKGQSIKNYVLGKTLGNNPDPGNASEDQAISLLSEFLGPRVEQALRGELSTKSIEDIRQIARMQVDSASQE